MDIFDEDLVNFWKSLSGNEVKYLMVGDMATHIHGFKRFEGILHIWIKDEIQNRKNLGSAMKIFGYEDLSWEEMQFIPGWTNFYISNGIVLDILISMKGLEGLSFDECHRFATIAEIENVKIPFLHINHLIANKKAVNRPKDQIDVIELEKIKILRKEMGLD
ncbi:MAG: hypothetical protein IPJ81_02590 [Chitinophagaceae bacterium]|nr:hypothetical protein [Chitinophagaceae bacterium]